MAERLSGMNLQRRAGRRRSTPASPTSPTFLRKYGRSQDSTLPVFPATDLPSGTTPSDSPSIDLNMPSPTFDMSSLAPALATDNMAVNLSQTATGFSADPNRAQPRVLTDSVRPATSGAAIAGQFQDQTRTRLSSEQKTYRISPVLGSQRPSSREEEAAAQRAAAFWAQYDRNTQEDTSTIRGQAPSKKSKFNLLSPISLFARRRSSQNTNKLEEASLNVGHLHVPAMPDDIEPSIRGTRIHDFSAPRTRRLNSDNSPRPGPEPSPGYPRRPSEYMSPAIESSVGTPASLHSPMFKEHFQEERRPVQPSNTAYLHAQSLQMPTAGSIPTFAKNLPLTLPDEQRQANALPESHHNDDLLESKDDFVPPQPDIPPPPPPKKTPSPVSFSVPPNALPRHMASTSSRFSYLGQQGSIAQERALEEKHKEHALKQPVALRMSMASVDDMDDYDDYDGYDENDGFDTGDVTIKNIDLPSSQARTDVPLAMTDNYDFEADDDDDEFGTDDIEVRNIDLPTSNKQSKDQDATDHLKVLIDSQSQSLQAFHFTPQSLSFSPSTAQFTSQPTPRDIEGFPIGTAQYKEVEPGLPPVIRDSTQQLHEDLFYEGLGIHTGSIESSILTREKPKEHPFDDFDFDDGEFGDDPIELSSQFHEDNLDDESKIRDIPAENARKYEVALQNRMPGDKVQVTQDLKQDQDRVPEPSIEDSSAEPAAQQAGLTEDNLAMYHDALAMAATKAAADGRFNRVVSFSQASDDETDSPFHNSIPAISSRGSRYSSALIGSGLSDDDAFGFDDEMDDDAMIAAANAEALENDDDGFYGQEFGFYARAYGRESAEFTNGGYFTARGSNGVKRSHSGKANFQEPSLTPITERSEWSARNSVANLNLQLHTGVNSLGQPLSSPGIAQLIQRDSPIIDDEMSLAALMKLRGRTFGGSSTSINSSGERHYPLSSPLSQSGGQNVHFGDGFDGRMSSPTPARNATSIAESEDEEDEGGRYTVTQNTPHKKRTAPARDTSHSSGEYVASSPMSRKGNHSRNSSGAESVSYTQDEGGRWVLERRRTGDDGEPELVGREYLAGMRI